MALKPIEKGCIGVGAGEPQSEETPGDAHFLDKREIMRAKKSAGEVKGCGQAVGGENQPSYPGMFQ